MPCYVKKEKQKKMQTNKGNVMQCILCEGPINRAAIAKRTSLSIPSVMTITEDLLQRGLIQTMGKGISNGGKRPELLSAVPESHYFVGVDIGRSSVRLVILNFERKVIFGTKQDTGDVTQPEAFIDSLCVLILDSISESRIDSSRLAGVGIAMPGLIEQESGHVLFSPDFGWNDIPLQNRFQNKLPYPVLVENSNRALALSESTEYLKDTEDTTHSILCVNIGHGIGAALIQNGELYYGSSGTSGEIGHITVNKDGPLCACGNSGCLEAVASGAAIAQQAQDAVRSGLVTQMLKLCNHQPETIDAKLVFNAAKGGDEVALSIIEKATDYIGVGIATAINILDPDKVILCGGLTKNGKPFFDRVVTSISRRQMRQAGRLVIISLGTKGDYSTAIGAALLIPLNGWRIPSLQHLYV